MISLEKRAETVKINLTKRNVQNITANICLMIDVSGSMSERFRQGIVQETIDRLFALAFNMDPDKVLDVFVFNTGAGKLSEMRESHYGNYVQTVLLNECSINGGTNYAPVINAVTNYYKPKKTGGFFGIGATEELGQPIYAIMITDGDNNDVSEASAAFSVTSPGNVYFQCIGIGNPSEFHFMESMGDAFDHVGFMNMNNLNVSDEELYDKLINEEFADWIKKFTTK